MSKGSNLVKFWANKTPAERSAIAMANAALRTANGKSGKKLTVEDIAHLRAMRLAGMSVVELAHEFGVGVSYGYRICDENCWRGIDPAPDAYDRSRP